MKKTLIYINLLLVFLLFASTAFAQQNYYKNRIGGWGGTMSYYGELIEDFPRIRNYAHWAYGLSYERSISKGLSLRLQGIRGTVSYNDRTLSRKDEFVRDNPNFNLGQNFLTNLYDGSLALVFYPDNGSFWLGDRAFISPYITVGAGFTFFDVYTDLKDEDGSRYTTAQLRSRTFRQDEDYETQVQTNEWAFNIPVGLGLKFRLSERINFNLEANAKYTFVDNFDNTEERSDDDNDINDIYAFFSSSLHYNFGLKGARKKFTGPILIADKFAALSKEDAEAYGLEAGIEGEGEDPTMDKEALTEGETAEDLANMSKKERRQARKAAKKAAKAEKKDGKGKGGKTSKKAKKQAISNCKTDCDRLESKKERKICKKTCKDKAVYTKYLASNEEDAKDSKSVDNATEDIAEEQEAIQEDYQERIDSLAKVIKEEKEGQTEKALEEAMETAEEAKKTATEAEKAAAVAEKAAAQQQNGQPIINVSPSAPTAPGQPIIVNTPSTPSPAPAAPGQPIIINTPSTPPPPIAPKGVSEIDVRTILNERDLQDMKLELEMLKLKQELKDSDKGGNNTTLELYKLETDRLRQEASENKIVGEIETLRAEIKGLRRSQRIEKEIIIEESSSDKPEIIIQERLEGETGVDKTKELNDRIERLKQQLQDMETETKTETKTETETETETEGEKDPKTETEEKKDTETEEEKKKEDEEKERAEIQTLKDQVAELQAELKKKTSVIVDSIAVVEKPTDGGLSSTAMADLNKEIQRLSDAITALTPYPTTTNPASNVVNSVDTRILETKIEELNRQLTGLAGELSAIKNIRLPEPQIIKIPAEPQIIKIPAEPKIIQIPAEPKIIKIPAEPQIIKIPAEPKIIQVPATSTIPIVQPAPPIIQPPPPIIQPTPPPVINYTPPPIIYPPPPTETRVIRAYDFCEELLQKRVEIFFDHNSARVKPSEVEKLNEVVNTLSECPEAKVAVNGHADKSGNAQYNLKLSQRRAEAVKYKLISDYGLASYRLLMNFYGEELAEGRNRNPFSRRVVLRYTR